MTDGITITRTFAASPEHVFALWTQAEHFAVWLGTDAIEIPDEGLHYEAVAGSDWAAIMKLPDGSSKSWVGEFLEIDPPTHLALTLTDEPSNPARATVTVDLEAIDGGTRMTMSQSLAGSDLSDDQVAGLTAGYNAFFDTMDKLVASTAE